MSDNVTWSQEYPTEPGEYWAWHRSWDSVRRCQATRLPSGELLLLFENYYATGGVWYTPAAVPQPPRPL
jgi:hypothetical protein